MENNSQSLPIEIHNRKARREHQKKNNLADMPKGINQPFVNPLRQAKKRLLNRVK